MKRKGFTLLEVLIVVIIIGILSSIALPQYLTTLEKARSVEAIAQMGTLRTSMERYWYEQKALQTTYPTGGATFAMGARGDLKLDVDNPNKNTQRLFNYSLTDTSNIDTKTFTIRAERISKAGTHWLQWSQTDNYTGKLFKSNALGGPES